MRVLHVATNLDEGGAQAVLGGLVRAASAGVEHEVVSLREPEVWGARLAAAGVPVHALGMRPGRPAPGALLRLVRLVRARRPDVVQTWMYHGDLLGGLAARLAGVRAIVWGIHNTTLPPGTPWSSRAVVRLCARLSGRVPARIVACAHAARRLHEGLGYPAAKMVVIHNGFDTEAFRPDPQARGEVRSELGLPPEADLVGLAARFHPQKDHRTFVLAAAEVAASFPAARFVLAGEGVDAGNAALAGWLRAAGVAERFTLLGRRRDVPRLMAALDALCSSSSHGEAFPLVVGEAMACGVPCVVTDVGDSSFLVGDAGLVAPPGDAPALAAALASLLRLGAAERARMGAAARRRIVEEFPLARAVRGYEALYRELAAAAARPGGESRAAASG